MTDEIPVFDDVVSDTKTASSSSSSSPGQSAPEVSEGVAKLIIDAIQQRGGAKQTIELPAFSRDAPDFKEAYVEHYGIEGVDTLSVEDLFQRDWEDYDYIGSPPVVDTDKLSDEEKEMLTDDELLKSNGDEKQYVIKPEWAEAFRDAKIDKGATTPISKALNGYHSDAIVEAFGEDTKMSVGKGKTRNHDDDEAEAMKYVAFWVSDSDTAPYKRKKAQYEVGEIDEEAFHEWCEANGFSEKL